MSEHFDIVRREFTRQAPSFAEARSFFGDAEIAEWVGAHAALGGDDLVLDVCGGAGHLSRRLSGRARQFVVLDLTRELLDTGARGAREETVGNVLFVEGDATRMPFVDGGFDVALSRFAFHHLDDPAAVAREMARVVRPGGEVAVMDMVDNGADHNKLERMRDPSHTAAVEADTLVALLRDAGIGAAIVAERRQALPAEAWLRRAWAAEEPAAAVLGALRAEADGGPRTGLDAHEDAEGVLAITQRWVIVAGRRAH